MVRAAPSQMISMLEKWIEIPDIGEEKRLQQGYQLGEDSFSIGVSSTCLILSPRNGRRAQGTSRKSSTVTRRLHPAAALRRHGALRRSCMPAGWFQPAGGTSRGTFRG